MANFNNKLIALLEKVGVVFMSAITGYFTLHYNWNIFNFKGKENFFSNTISFVSILLGIVVTMATLFLGYSNKQVVKKIKLRDANKLMFRYFIVPIITGLILSISTIYLSLISDELVSNNLLGVRVTVVYLVFMSIFLISTIRIFGLMLIILKDVFEEDIYDQQQDELNKSENNENIPVEVHFDDDAFK